jgi:pSer/pThr/pTyr-binding forkhead associated (FHA) protein
VKILFELVDEETPGRLASSAPDSDEKDAQAMNGGVLTKTRASTPTLLVVDGEDRGRRLPLVGKNQFKIGRSVTSDLKLADGKISRDHCMVETVRDQFIIIDLESANGTIVNGDRVKKTVLKEGDFIRLGFTMIKYDRV